ncbi:MAG: DNA-binding protein [Firmicutes bacterium HGW-Firmicutes-7]|nr:MAG: DNA-binding protein [Firmicutes bacterium HGW-Firmicutes-7]
MNEIVEKTLLYDFYGELLTDNQKKIYGYYHLDDLSLGEISEQMNISRQGVFDALKRCDHQLRHFEEMLQLVKKFAHNTSRVQEIAKLVGAIKGKLSSTDESLLEEVNRIEYITKSLLKDL